MQRKIIENKRNRENKIIFAYFLKHPDTFIPSNGNTSKTLKTNKKKNPTRLAIIQRKKSKTNIRCLRNLGITHRPSRFRRNHKRHRQKKNPCWVWVKGKYYDFVAVVSCDCIFFFTRNKRRSFVRLLPKDLAFNTQVSVLGGVGFPRQLDQLY